MLKEMGKLMSDVKKLRKKIFKKEEVERNGETELTFSLFPKKIGQNM